MSELVVLALKVLFLALLWLLILFAGNVIRTDVFGRKVPAGEAAENAPTGRQLRDRPAKRAGRKLPRTLKVTRGAQAGTVLDLGEEVKIGRSSDCQLILDDDYVSTRHARIYLDGKSYSVEDLGSTNGTYVNNERITVPTPFGPDDTLRIGRTLMSVEK